MPLTPGSRLGACEIVAALGAGGMGEVYKARDTRLDRTVAIKVLTGHVSDRPSGRSRPRLPAYSMRQPSAATSPRTAALPQAAERVASGADQEQAGEDECVLERVFGRWCRA